MINGHGDDIYSYNSQIISNFSSNIFSKQDLSALHEHLCSHINAIRSYPEPDAASLIKLLAQQNGVTGQNICITNGATEAIYLIAQAFRRSRSAILYPTFSEYGDACMINKHIVYQIKSLDEIPAESDLIWLCNPNNPTGTVIDKRVLLQYIENHPDKYLIIDQSYEHFTLKELFSISEAVQYKNVIILHSMTKHYAIPGLRLGYITAHADTLAAVSSYCMPWSVNGLAIEAGKFLLQNEQSMNIANYLEETKRLQKNLSQLQKIVISPTDTHFFLCNLAERKASELKRYLIDNYGILIRDASNFYGLNEYYFRIATQSSEENDLLVKAIKEWI